MSLTFGCVVALVFNGFDTIKHFENAGHAHPIKDLRPAFFIFNDADALQQAQMSRNGWHFSADQVGKVADATLPAREFVENEQARRMCESLDNCRMCFESGLSRNIHFHI